MASGRRAASRSAAGEAHMEHVVDAINPIIDAGLADYVDPNHKITDEVCAFAEAELAADPALRPADLVAPIAERFGVRVHPRSIERAVARYADQQSKSR